MADNSEPDKLSEGTSKKSALKSTNYVARPLQSEAHSFLTSFSESIVIDTTRFQNNNTLGLNDVIRSIIIGIVIIAVIVFFISVVEPYLSNSGTNNNATSAEHKNTRGVTLWCAYRSPPADKHVEFPFDYCNVIVWNIDNVANTMQELNHFNSVVYKSEFGKCLQFSEEATSKVQSLKANREGLKPPTLDYVILYLHSLDINNLTLSMKTAKETFDQTLVLGFFLHWTHTDKIYQLFREERPTFFVINFAYSINETNTSCPFPYRGTISHAFPTMYTVLRRWTQVSLNSTQYALSPNTIVPLFFDVYRYETEQNNRGKWVLGANYTIICAKRKKLLNQHLYNKTTDCFATEKEPYYGGHGICSQQVTNDFGSNFAAFLVDNPFGEDFTGKCIDIKYPLMHSITRGYLDPKTMLIMEWCKKYQQTNTYRQELALDYNAR